jgi:hypothetical protein
MQQVQRASSNTHQQLIIATIAIPLINTNTSITLWESQGRRFMLYFLNWLQFSFEMVFTSAITL